MDFRVGSAPARTSHLGSGSAHISDPVIESLSGFLNRKCVQEAGGKKSKDRSWQTFWCQLKGLALDFYRVDGVKCEGTRPPPRDIYPLPHLAQHKAGFLSLEGAEVEVDYTSQIDKDLQKRRDFLFQLTLPNKVVYLLQAPGANQRVQWVQHLKKARRGYHGDDIEGRVHYDTKIKAARCSVRHRSRQNVLSLKDSQTSTSPEEDAELAAAFREDPRLQLLRKRLTAKRELLSQLNRMYNAFLGDSVYLYSEDVHAQRAIPPVAAEPAASRRLSLPSPRFSSLLPPSQLDPRRASTGGFSAPLSSSNHIVTAPTGVRTELLQDYRLVPGASWSVVRQGERVRVTGKLTNGWYRCLVERDTLASIAPSQSISSHLSEASVDSGFLPSERQSLISDTLPASPTHRREGRHQEKEEEEEEEMFVADVLPDEADTCVLPKSGAHDQSHDQSHEVAEDKAVPESLPATSRHGHLGMRVGRSYSYIIATESNFESSLLPRQQQQLPEAPRQGGEVEGKRPRVSSMDGYLTDLLESELQTGRYTFPLVGVLPPSVLRHIPQMDDLPVLPPLPSPSHSPTHHSPSPFHSPTHHPPPSPSHPLSQQLPPSPSHSPTPHEELAQPSAPRQNGGLVASHAALSPSHALPTRRPKSSSAPVTPNVTPTHTPSPSPIPPAPHTTPTSNGSAPDEQAAHSLPPSGLTSSQKHHPSPSRRPRAMRRRSHEPIATIMDSGHSFIKKLFPRRKTSKQSSISEVPHAPTIAEETFPTSVLPPPMLQDLRDNEFEESPRMRVASMSGRPIRNTGIALVIGEEESSSGSDSESSHEESAEAAVLSQSLPSSSPLATALLHSGLSPAGESSAGSLRRTASAHDSLNVKTEPMPITTETRAKSGSTHSLKSVSLTSPFRGFQPFWRSHAASDEPPKRKSSRKKKRGSWSEAMEGESPKLSGIFRQPPTGQKRFVYLDPRQPKYGFRLESYGRPRERGRVIQTFVQSVAPGSPAFMNGLFPGDTILEVNGVSVRHEPMTTIVNLITSSPRNSSDKIQLVVMFVDGVTRLERMKRADQLKYNMKIKQAQLREMRDEEHHHLSHLTHLPNARSIILATDLRPWSHTIFPADSVPHPFPYDSALNDLVSLHIGSPSQLAADVLVVPLCATFQSDCSNILTQLLHEGGSELIDELCLASYCPLGENIRTQGHQLPSTYVYHCVFGNLEESLQSCIRHALEEGSNEEHSSIVFWLDGFTAVNVSPHTVIEAVRLWLQEGGNSIRFRKVVFSARANPSFAELLLQRYFPLHPFTARGSVSSTEEEVAAEESVGGTVRETWHGQGAEVATSTDVIPAMVQPPAAVGGPPLPSARLSRTPPPHTCTPGTPPPSTTPPDTTPPSTTPPDTTPPSTPTQGTPPTPPGTPHTTPGTLPTTLGTPHTTPGTPPLATVQKKDMHTSHRGFEEEGGEKGEQKRPAEEVATGQGQPWSGVDASTRADIPGQGSGAGVLSASPRVLNPLRLESDV